MLFSRTPSRAASPIKSPTKSVCRVKVIFNTLHTIIGDQTAIDFHFFRDLFGIALTKDPDRNPTVLQVNIENEHQVFISKNSFTTQVQIRYSNEDTWKSLFVSDKFELKNTAFAKVDGYEIMFEKVVVQIPAVENKPKKVVRSPPSTGSQAGFNLSFTPKESKQKKTELSPIKTTRFLAESPRDTSQKKEDKRNFNLWDYFGKDLSSGKKSVVNKPAPKNKKEVESPRYKVPSAPDTDPEQAPSEDDECSVKAILKRMTKKSEEEKQVLLEKRQIGPSLSDVENEIEEDGGLHKKKFKQNGYDSDDTENIEDSNFPTDDTNQSNKKAQTSFMFESSQVILGSKRNKNKTIQLLGEEEEEEKRAFPAARNGRLAFGDLNEDNNGICSFTAKNRIEEEKISSADFKSTANKSTPIKSPKTHATHTCSPQIRMSLEVEKNLKLKRLKRIIDDRRETVNKGSATKDPINSQEKEQQSGKETCPICLGDVGNEVGKLNDCIHTFCFDCIKDWSDVTNECPLCKRKFNEITKYLLKEGGVSVKLETLPVEDKKQRVHDDGGDFVDEDEDIDDNCYECRQDDNLNVLLICDGCGFYCCHTYCCNPPLDFIPEEDWFCKHCVRQYSRSRRTRTRNNQRNTVREESTEPRNAPRATRRSARQGRESTLEAYLRSGGELDKDMANLGLYQENYWALEDEFGESSNTFDSASINTRSSSRRLNRNQSNSRNAPVVEDRPQRRARRNVREEDETNLTDLIDLENFYFNQAESQRHQRQQQTRASRSNTRMLVESAERQMSPMSMDDLNQFTYPLRSQGRSNY